MALNPNRELSDTKLHLIYHELADSPSDYTYAISASRFEEHLQALKSIGHSAYAGRVTFDDGHRSQLQYAVPLLAKHGISAIFFIATGWTNVRNEFMTSAQLCELVKLGHVMGSHSVSHPMLPHCSQVELEQELGNSRRFLEDTIGAPISSISLPHGRYNQRVLMACAAAGYTEVFTSDPEIAVRNVQGVQILGRFNVLGTMQADALVRLLDPASGDLSRYASRARMKGRLRALLGDRLYHRLWSLVSHAS